MKDPAPESLPYHTPPEPAPHSVVAIASFCFASLGAVLFVVVLVASVFAFDTTGKIVALLPISLLMAFLGLYLSLSAMRDDHQRQVLGTWGFYLSLGVLLVEGLIWLNH